MNSRQRIRAIIAGEEYDRTGLWLGNPHQETWEIYTDYFGVETEEQVRRKLGDDVRWVCQQFLPGAYQHPDGQGMFDAWLSGGVHASAGPLADAETREDLDAYPWPSVDYLNFDGACEALDAVGEHYRLGGFWTCFYHNLMDLFGMEAYMMKMLLNPEIVHAVTDRVCEFYYEANRRLFEVVGDRIDGFFFGNDFGTQLDLICGPTQFDEFIMPWFRRFTELGHEFGYQVVLHSCGAIHKVIDRLIDAGVDCLHPIQAKASHMEAERLAADFGGRIAFMGGVDTQDLLVNATPDQVADDVRRLKKVLGPKLIVSPSHEAVLPNVPPENIEAMAAAALEA